MRNKHKHTCSMHTLDAYTRLTGSTSFTQIKSAQMLTVYKTKGSILQFIAITMAE